ncbi:hypothetical protein B0H17DRAFT_1220478 [Mycena rosella]|uniref:Uncharacterized protein n=1 Tax=Mycena rosella TaxID=1033263 RepID=A0AAD7BAA2_MYCRO|nr:hypothetical protein B0H17DRAFT_1220478 [Mycena rosella]
MSTRSTSHPHSDSDHTQALSLGPGSRSPHTHPQHPHLLRRPPHHSGIGPVSVARNESGHPAAPPLRCRMAFARPFAQPRFLRTPVLQPTAMQFNLGTTHNFSSAGPIFPKLADNALSLAPPQDDTSSRTSNLKA